jgi:hypothetical protein
MPSSNPSVDALQHRCPPSSARKSAIIAALLAATLTVPDARACAQSTPGQAARPHERRIADAATFLAGGVLALGMHEGGHLIFDALFDANPKITHVQFGPFPFFAVSHRTDLSPRREFTVSSAGFWVQEATNEWLLTRRPHLRREHAPLAKGVFAFNVLNSIGYGAVAFAKAGPVERDTRGMAAAISVDERAIAAIVLGPALLDAYRYFKPESKWAKWASRIAKGGGVLLVIKRP